VTTTLRSTQYLPQGHGRPCWDVIALGYDERRVRRKLLHTVHGEEVMVDLAQPTTLDAGGALLLEDGRCVDIVAAEERLYEVRGRDAFHLLELTWHLGNRHTRVQLDGWDGNFRLVIQRDHVLRDMLTGLGATVTEISEPWGPIEGAYSGHAHAPETHALLRK